MNLLLYFEFDSGVETRQQSYDDLRGIPIPQIGDCVCPGQGDFKVINHTFAYQSEGLTIYYVCEKQPD